MPEDTPETREHDGTTTLSSGKVKVVALFAAAPSAAILFWLLYRAARRLGMIFDDAGPAAGWKFLTGFAFFLALFLCLPGVCVSQTVPAFDGPAGASPCRPFTTRRIVCPKSCRQVATAPLSE